METEDYQPTDTEILLGVVNRFIGLFSRQIQKRTGLETSREYPFIAMDTRQVFQELVIARDRIADRFGPDEIQDKKFLDVGCGFGNVMLFAEQFGFDVYGIEKDAASIEKALLFFESERIISQDITSFDRYGEFDVVYFFCPLTEGEREFEEFLEDQIRPGAILIGNYKRSKKIETDSRFERLSEELPVWEKVSP